MVSVLKLSAAIAAAAMLASCQKISVIPAAGGEEGESVEITVSVRGSGETRTVGQTLENEEKINSLQVFVFRTDGERKLDASEIQTGETVSVRCTGGARRIYAVVNAPDLRADVEKEEDLLSLKSGLAENSLSGLVMIGHVDKTISATGEKISVTVERITSSIIIKKVTNSFSSPAYQNSEFIITDIYLLNVAGSNTYGMDSFPEDADDWFNRLSKSTNAFPVAGMTADMNIDSRLNYGKSYTGVHTFYAYPNSSAVSTDSAWCPRATLLVVETSLDGTVYYYPIAIDNLRNNCQYIIENLTVTRPGSLTPYEPVQFATCDFSIVVADWKVSFNRSEEI